MKISVRNAGVALAVVLLIILVYAIIPKSADEEKVEEKNVNTDNLDNIEFKVTTSKIYKGDLIKWVNANGYVKAAREMEIQANIAGYIKELNVYEGKRVNKDDLLLAIDDTQYQLAYNSAVANVNGAYVDFSINFRDSSALTPELEKRRESINKKLADLNGQYKSGKLKKEEYEAKMDELEPELILSGAKRKEVAAAKSNLTSYRVARQQAELNLSYTKIHAPFSGVIGDIDLITGQRINSAVKLFKIYETSVLKIEVRVLENDIASIALGNFVEVMIGSLPNEKFTGKVLYISPQIDTSTKTCKVIVELQNKNDKIKPGMFATVNIQAATFRNRMLAPIDALVVRDKRNLVFMVVGNLAKWEYFDIGEQNDRCFEIVGGNLKVGDEVVVKGHTNLAHDAKVKVIERQ